MRDRARLVDALLKTAWSLHVGEHVRDVALIAVGGYGRGELNLCSDIDIMILLPKSEATPWQSNLEALPDVHVGHRPRGRPQRAHDR